MNFVKRSLLENFTPKLSEVETSILMKAYISLKNGYEEKCTEVFKICNLTIQPQKAHKWYPQTKLCWYNPRTAYTIKKIMTRGYMYRIFGRQQFNYSTKKSAYITYHFPKWQCVKVKYTEESVPNKKYFLRTHTTIQQGKKRSLLENFTPKAFWARNEHLPESINHFKFGYEEKCTEVFKICNSTIQPQKAHIWYPQTKLW